MDILAFSCEPPDYFFYLKYNEKHPQIKIISRLKSVYLRVMKQVKQGRVRLTKEFVFDMGHALFGYDGPCKDIHGHTYHLSVTVIGVPLYKPGDAKDGMVIDFGLIKAVVHDKIISRFDHALVLNEAIPSNMKQSIEEITGKVVYLPVQPSCENLLLHFKDELLAVFEKKGWELHSLKLYETPTSFAEWYASDQVD